MEKLVAVKCINTHHTKLIPKGTTLQALISEFGLTQERPFLGAMVNNVLKELSFEVYRPKTIEFIDITHPDGMRMYTRSLFFVLYMAVDELFPGKRLRIEHAISKGYFAEIMDLPSELTSREILDIQQRMSFIINKNMPFIRFEEETDTVIRKFEEIGMHDKAELLRHRGRNYSSYYKSGRHIGAFYGYLVPSTAYLSVFDLKKYYDGMLLRVPQRAHPAEVEEMVMQEKMFGIFREFIEWNKILDVTTISDLNRVSRNGRSDVMIKVSESLHEKKIAHISDLICERRNKVKFILISGPSSSGKTTFGKRLAIQLIVNGIKPLNLSLDNYFKNREDTPLDEQGNYDFEALEALDLDLFNQQLQELSEGKSVALPKFSFQTGSRVYDGETMQMKTDNMLIIEGLHGLNPKLTHAIPAEAKFKVYVSALTSICFDDLNPVRTADNRLIRRIVRDYMFRKYSAKDTISRWQSVRRGEDKYIFPYQEEADAMFNSALLYELAVLKAHAEPILLEVNSGQPEYAEAVRLLKFLSFFKNLRAWEIPRTSILREFLGGSSFSY